MIRNFTRKVAFEIVRRDMAIFLRENEAELLKIFREELQRLDDEIPEENTFIDIKVVPLGEAVIKASLRAFERFLTQDFSAADLSHGGLDELAETD
jgi:hypothetical protein